MPITQRFTDRNKVKANIITGGYILLTVILAILLIKRAVTAQKPSNQESTDAVSYICVESDIQESVLEKLTQLQGNESQYKISLVTQQGECSVIIARNIQDPNKMKKLFDTTYILVRSSEIDSNESELINITNAELFNSLITQQYNDYTLIWDQETDSFLKSAFEIGVGQIVYPTKEIISTLQNEKTLAIIKSVQREEWMEVISIDEYSPFKDNFNSTRYPLVDRYWIGGSSQSDIDKIYDILVK